VDAPAAYRFAPSDARDTANTAWWRAFGDPALDGLIDEALAHNWDARIAAANVDAAAAVLTQVQAPLYPQIGYGAEGLRERVTESGTTPLPALARNPRNGFQVLAGASWEVDLWGRLRRQSEAAGANLLGTEEARRGVILSLVGTVASSYLELLGLDEQLAVAKKTQATYRESLRLFELQFKYGQVSEMNVAQARSQYETATAQIPGIERQIAQLENALSLLVGRNPGPIARGKTIKTLAGPAVPAGVPSQLLERRPDVLQAEQQLVAANAQIGAAKALYFPSISLTGALGSASSQLSDLFSGPARTWNFAGSIVGPIFTAGAISGQVAQAEAGQRAAADNYQRVVQGAFADVSNALVDRQKLVEQLAAQQKLVAALRDYTRLARIQYDGGYVPYSTVLQAEQQLFPAELALATTRAASLSALVSIYKALGGGWVDDAAARAPAPASQSAPPASRGA
jgi:multidrug efflux system outer membrane protein